MYRKSGDSWLKHLDFIVLDLVALQLAYISSLHYAWEQEIYIRTVYI